jgi:phosphoglycolate phosphatase-like HAD superfamily hydrolase
MDGVLDCRAMSTVSPVHPTRLILFDIDGTLVSWAGIAGQVFRRALSGAAGREVSSDGYSFAGRTDPEIARDLLLRAGVDQQGIGARVERVLELYLEGFSEIARQATTPVLKPGVRVLLDRLHTEPTVCLGLLTGNVEEGANIKLGHFDVRHYFRVGAFGSDASDRNALLPIAVERARGATGVVFAGRQIVIVGDTPRDIECARLNGAQSLGVATGPHSRAELEASGADWVFENLRDTEAVLRALLDGDRERGGA